MFDLLLGMVLSVCTLLLLLLLGRSVNADTYLTFSVFCFLFFCLFCRPAAPVFVHSHIRADSVNGHDLVIQQVNKLH